MPITPIMIISITFSYLACPISQEEEKDKQRFFKKRNENNEQHDFKCWLDVISDNSKEIKSHVQHYGRICWSNSQLLGAEKSYLYLMIFLPFFPHLIFALFSGFSSDGYFGAAGPAWKYDEEERGKPVVAFILPFFAFAPYFIVALFPHCSPCCLFLLFNVALFR